MHLSDDATPTPTLPLEGEGLHIPRAFLEREDLGEP
jgi:hypothetical protein